MHKRWIHRPSPALVISCLALAVALTGTSYATVLNVPRKSVGTPQLKRGAVGTPNLKRNAVKARQLAPNAVRSAHVLNGSLLAADFKAGQIPQGPRGEKGEKGDKGDVGVSGLEVVQRASPSTSSSKQVKATCPSGKKVVGGGAYVDAFNGLVLRQSYPESDLSGWVAGAFEGGGPVAANWIVVARAICANVAS